MYFNWQNQQRPILGLSPMADMTDTPFCKIIRKTVLQSVSDSRLIVFREMVSSEAIVRGNEKTMIMTGIDPIERPIVQQIFGANPETMGKSSRIIMEATATTPHPSLEKEGGLIKRLAPDAIDINMGCPVYKMINNFNGAALMKDPGLAAKIVQSVKSAVNVPVSVKIRAGWSSHEECIEFAKVIENAGADMITVHGRTQKQAYSGVANRKVVAQVKANSSIPILYNGDIFTWQNYFQALDDTKCDGALIARGALGNPWIFAQIEQHLADIEVTYPTLEEKIKTVIEHLETHLEHYGESSISTFRKHLGWYFKGVDGFKQYKQAIMTATEKEVIIKALNEFLSKQTNAS
ncbi:MAG: tRNA-dihydrouridine synthase [Candidatus Uhrbacteria bacterium GW2011_GWD2_41_121]|uniref:tRNA-dihydrouridine synthase n=1 Tax=Candidatus Uhrbacteria bacterium GW2011_GWC1_41_20 TaxID=1618983 RepID=A0A0G0VH64_9BACT|nr:MAG: tRNA-dihydrouridine synthase [Candidatus Uhrbacteria bacterium GW2011_GWE1_39_46]KKR63489.1 MAG: tRNA-dihydrouridine synthase [Candidatus Uhrbacteria bacterium GW2011_GWC2_40_450]KKR89703.1 MAG: tRNA-dihydrouridine synthase [Candidatus Uhrbacteria bacterium GW2011_GWD2_41_121]KKR95863.1 MAG: tRNA-dihydrouridine synthase [Candidatus Uhrbacteria bacterium GW2011_GWD1_41_16]KKR98996.1 MAG: TIM-barrel protein, nifR3 family [Candidatus Uhrbacteria bacterium GW2011_GWC1_41_20]KKS07213.1 MAG: